MKAVPQPTVQVARSVRPAGAQVRRVISGWPVPVFKRRSLPGRVTARPAGQPCTCAGGVPLLQLGYWVVVPAKRAKLYIPRYWVLDR